jgi:hypothetical protein
MKTKLKITLQLIVLFLFAGLFACKDECSTYYANPEAIHYGAFKKGSWWIYQDDSTGVRDCVYVTKVTQSMFEMSVDKKCRWKGERILTLTKSNKYDWELPYSVSRDDNETGLGIRFNKCQCSLGNTVFRNNLIIDSKTHFFSSIVVQNKIYENVIYTKEQYSYFTEVWYSKNVGIIKIRSNYDGFANLSLINYNIIPYE